MEAALAGNLVAPVGDDLVDVHVGLRAGARLPHHQREVAVQLAGEDLVRHGANEVGVRAAHVAKAAVCLRRGSLELRKRTHNLIGHALGANGEVLVAALGLGAPEGVLRHEHLSHGVALHAPASGSLGRRGVLGHLLVPF